MIKAWKRGSFSYFSQRDWETGCPQKNGWQAESEQEDNVKKIPAAITEFVTKRNQRETEPEDPPTGEETKQDDLPETLEEWKAVLDELGIKYSPNTKNSDILKNKYLAFIEKEGGKNDNQE